MLFSARSPSSWEDLRPRFPHPGTSQPHPRLLHASPSPTVGLVLGHSQPKPPRLSRHPGPQAAGSPATLSFHCPLAAPDHAQQNSSPFLLSHWLFLPNRAGTRLAVSRWPRLCSRPGQGRGFCWPHPLEAGPGSQAFGNCLGRARLGSAWLGLQLGWGWAARVTAAVAEAAARG